MAWISNTFECLKCDCRFDELYQKGHEEDVECPQCDSKRVEKQLAAPSLGRFSMATDQAKAEMLKKRSEDHTTKEVRREPERWGEPGKVRAGKKIQVGYSGKK